MALIVNDDGGIEVGPPDGDPVRAGHAEIIRELALKFEGDLQMAEAFDAIQQQHKARLAALESRVAMLEALLLGECAA